MLRTDKNQGVFAIRDLILVLSMVVLNFTLAKNSVVIAREAKSAGPRIVHFPDDHSLGMLMTRSEGAGNTSIEWWWASFIDWQYLGDAKGEVTVPAGKRLALIVGADGWKDLSPLANLRPDDLDMLAIKCSRRAADKPGDKCVPHISSLAGLKVLILEYAGISNDGLRLLRQLESLTHLSLISEHLDDTGLAHIAEIKSLRGLRFFSTMVTNDGLSNLAKLTLLEQLFPSCNKIDADGLVHFAKLTRLGYLLLSGEKFGDEGPAHLKKLPALRKLDFLRPAITETWLQNLSNLTGLEELSIRNNTLDDEQLAFLKSLQSLKRLFLQPRFQQMGDRLTDTGLAHLKQIQSLESVEFYYGRFTDKGLEHLAGLKNLTSIAIPNCHSFSDAGLKHLARLRSLEHLNIGSGGLSDAGMSEIGRLTGLKELKLFNSRSITNDGLAGLAGLTGLIKLELWVPKVTSSGLNYLNTLSNLTVLDVRGGYAKDIRPDDAVLHIEQLTRLEQLRLPVFCDEDMACLANLPNLKELQITSRGMLTDRGIAHLKDMTSLNKLSIQNAHLTDEGLRHVANMNKLGQLTISGDFTDRGLGYLQELRGLTYLGIISARDPSPVALQSLRAELPNLQQIRSAVKELPKVTVRRLQTGKKLPDFENINIDFSADQNKDKMILLCFCDVEQRPSRSRLQKLAERADELAEKSITILAVQVSKLDGITLSDWGKKLNVTFPLGIVSGDSEKIRLDWNINALPWLILTDRNHVVRAQGFGLDDLDKKIGPAAKQ